MKALAPDFAPRRGAPWWLWSVVAAISLALGAHEGGHAWRLRQERSRVEDRTAVLRSEIAHILGAEERAETRAQAQAQSQAAYAQDASAIARMAQFPLARVLSALEAARVEGVRLTAIEASAADGKVRAELEFNDHAALLRYLEGINAGEPARRWELLQAQGASATGPGSATLVSGWTARH